MASEKVAENSRVWRFLGSRATALRTSSMKPMSSMRSASSRTSTSTCVEVDGLLADEVEQAARRGDEDLDAAPERLDLRALGHAAVDHGRADVGALAQGGDALVDLHRQLAGGRQHQGADGVARGADARVRVAREALEDRQREGGGLAGARLGGGEDVAAGEDEGNGGGLDGGGLRVALALDGGEQLGREAEVGEGQGGLLVRHGARGSALVTSSGARRLRASRHPARPGGVGERVGHPKRGWAPVAVDRAARATRETRPLPPGDAFLTRPLPGCACVDHRTRGAPSQTGAPRPGVQGSQHLAREPCARRVVGHDRVRHEGPEPQRRDRGREPGIDRVEDEHVAQVRRTGGPRPARSPRGRATASIRSAGPLSALPPMIARHGDDRHAPARAAGDAPRASPGRRGSARPRRSGSTARSRWPRRPRARPATSGVGAASVEPGEPKLADVRLLAAVDEVLLELEPAVGGPDLGRDRLVGHRQDPRRDPERRAGARGTTSVRRAPASTRAGPRRCASRGPGRRAGTTSPRRSAPSCVHHGVRVALDAPAPARPARSRRGCRGPCRGRASRAGRAARQSSPVLTMTVRPRARRTAWSPSASLAPPTPPASSTTRAAHPFELLERPRRSGRSSRGRRAPACRR